MVALLSPALGIYPVAEDAKELPHVPAALRFYFCESPLKHVGSFFKD